MWNNIDTVLWLFPIAFMLHDFEEIIFWEAWLGKNGESLLALLPMPVAKRMRTIVNTSTAQVSFSILLIFLITILSTLAAAQWGRNETFLLTSSMFFVHGFGHFAQAIVLRKYVPGVLTSAIVIMPFGALLFPKLLAERFVDGPELLAYFALGAVVMAPFILGMHVLGGFLYPRLLRLFIGPDLRK
jgi:hypothetical protein